MRIKQSQLFLAFLTIFVAAGTVLSQQTTYPATKRVDHFDEYFGEKVHDPYRWLEGDAHESEEVAAWVEAQNKVTFDYLKSIPQRQAIHQRLTELWNYEKISAPFIAGDRYYFTKNDGLQNHSVVYMMNSLSDEPRVLFDPNKWSEDGTVALGGMAFSDDGKHVAYGTSEGGSDWRTWKVRNIQTGEDLVDELKWIKFSSPAWTIDGKGFFYSRYAAPEEGTAFVSVNEFQKLYYHRIGTEQAKDVLVYENQTEPKWGFGPEVTEDGRYLIVTIWKGTGDKYRVMYKDLHEPFSMMRHLIREFANEYTFLSNDGPVFFFRTDLNAPKRRVIAIDIREPQKEHWKEIISESDDTLNGVSLVGDMFIASYLQDAKSAVRIFDMQGKFLRDVHLPGIGSSYGFGGKRKHTETFYGFSSFAIPPSTYRYDIKTGKSTLLNRANVDMNPSDYITTQKFYTSKDGTRVPMFITHKKGIKLDGTNPTLLYAYGGFNISITPRFSITRLAWMEMGGVYAVANIRGGGEYGEQWHQAGTKLNKQNVFDDFIAAAEWLIDNKYTNPSKLAIQGGSNGGLLVGACMAQRPDLYGACLPAVGVMDMLRFHKFTIGWAWVDDYGSSDDPEQYKALRAYSPYHNLTPSVAYPPTLVTTADFDDRVVPGHSFKFASALQYAQAGDAPVLIRIETKAGHGAGKPTTKRIEEAADLWAFLVKSLGMDVD